MEKNNNGGYFVDENPTWLKSFPEEYLFDNIYRNVLDFFVLHSPCKDLSVRSRSLNDFYHWSIPWSKPFWLNKQLKECAENYKILFSAATYAQMEQELIKADLALNFPTNISKERICFYNNKKNQFMSVFYHLRNSLAHGRFNIMCLENSEKVYILEDVSGREKERKVSARMIIKEKTLVNWMELIKGGEKEYIKSK